MLMLKFNDPQIRKFDPFLVTLFLLLPCATNKNKKKTIVLGIHGYFKHASFNLLFYSAKT